MWSWFVLSLTLPSLSYHLSFSSRTVTVREGMRVPVLQFQRRQSPVFVWYLRQLTLVVWSKVNFMRWQVACCSLSLSLSLSSSLTLTVPSGPGLRFDICMHHFHCLSFHCIIYLCRSGLCPCTGKERHPTCIRLASSSSLSLSLSFSLILLLFLVVCVYVQGMVEWHQ